MAAGPTTQVSDIVVPEIFSDYVQQLTAVKSRLIQSGVLAQDAFFDDLLSGGGKTFNIPSFKDLDDADADNVSTDDPADLLKAAFGTAAGSTRTDSIPLKIETAQEIAVRMSRNQSWSSADLAMALAGPDPLDAIAGRVSDWWMKKLQKIFIATLNGVFLDNDDNDSGDYTTDVSGASFVDGVTNFSTEAFIDATLTMGDSMEDTNVIMVHSIVYGRMQKNNLIDFIPDARGETNIPVFLGRQVIIDDGMPNAGGVFDSWLFQNGAIRLGVGSPKVSTEVERHASSGNGGGGEVLFNRQEWLMHPTGHKFVDISGVGGPTNTNLALAASWDRVYTERNQIKIARLISRES